MVQRKLGKRAKRADGSKEIRKKDKEGTCFEESLEKHKKSDNIIHGIF